MMSQWFAKEITVKRGTRFSLLKWLIPLGHCYCRVLWSYYMFFFADN